MRRWIPRRLQFNLKSLFISTLLMSLLLAYVRALICGGRRQAVLAVALEARFASTRLRPRTDWPAAWVLPAGSDLVLTEMHWKPGVSITDADLGLLAEARWLRRCKLRDCGLDDGKVQFLSSMNALESLDLSDNPITDRGAALAASSSRLQRLYLKGTRIEGAFIRDLPCRNVLSGLVVSDTLVTGEYLVTVRDFRALESLYLNGLRRADECAASIAGLRLRLLMLNDSDLSDAGFVQLSGTETLREVYIDRTSVTPRGLVNVKSLRALHTLSLGGLSLTRAVFEAVATLPELMYLDLSRCNFTENDLDALRHSHSVSNITLSHTNLTDAGLQQLIDLPALEIVNVCDTRVTARAAEEFEAQHADCIVSFQESRRR